jgi:hypothetical protein
MTGRPRIRGKIWEKVVQGAKEEGRQPSELVEDAVELYLSTQDKDDD